MIENPIAKKLLIKSGHTVLLINAPQGIDVLLGDPLRKLYQYDSLGQFDVVVLFAHNLAEVDNFALKALKNLKENTVFWATYPKGSSKIKTDINRDKGWEILEKAGYEGVSIVSMNETWSALRFMQAGKTISSRKARETRNQKKYQFTGVLIDAGGGGVFVDFPYSVEEEFGVKGQVKIKCTIDGEPYKGSLANMGGVCHILIVLKAIREKIGKQVGDSVKVVLEQDSEDRVVIVPAELQTLLNQNLKASKFFEKLSYTHRKEYVRWIEEAKRPETRAIRLEKTIQMLLKEMKTK